MVRCVSDGWAIVVGDIRGRGQFVPYCPLMGHKGIFCPRTIVALIRLNPLALFMAEVDPDAKTVKVRLKGELATELQAFAEENGLGLSSALRLLVSEALRARHLEAADENDRRRRTSEMFRRQIGGN